MLFYLLPPPLRCVADDDDDDDDVVDDDNDGDYKIQPERKTRASRTRGRSSPSRRRHSRANESDHEEPILADEPESESGSDCDWNQDGPKKTLGRRSRKSTRSRPSKRARTQEPEDDDAARSSRVNSRLGYAVNYFESDDGEDEDGPAKDVNNAVNTNVLHVDRVVDYRLREGVSPPDPDAPPFSDFKVQDVEFRIKWLNKSYRKCTWEPFSALHEVKGAKRVKNYIKEVEMSRRNNLRDDINADELEEIKIAREEYRASLSGFEDIDRVIAQRDSAEDESESEFLVKWNNLPYVCSTWESRSDLMSNTDLKAIDDFIDRESSVLNNSSKKRFNPFSTKEDRPKFKRMAEQPSYLHGEGRTLRDYQLAGLNFLAFSWSKRNNVILADEMGLGKTLQTISFLGWLMYCRHIPGQFLVVVPLSTIPAWQREFARWLPEMNVVCYIGDAPSREMIREHEFYSTKKKVEKFHVMLTTPELLMMDHQHFDELRWAMVAVDEAHRLKNEAGALHITLANLRSANRLLITGTPLQNSVRELWALLHFLNPSVFVDADEFEEHFSFTALRDPERVSSLHKTLRPYIIRRQKGDVEKSLPKKTYSVLRVGMTSTQQQYYRWLLTKNFTKLNSSVIVRGSRGMGSTQGIRNLLMELKKCCNHPFLFPGYEDTTTPTSVEELIRASGKMILLDKLLLRLREKGHRVLIFSQMVRMLDILQDYCRMRSFPCQRLDGSVENELRQRAVDHFNAPDSNDFIFLLSTRAGGLGINLATADTVIIFDSDWNPQNDLQAESRAHRIGQKKDVKVFRLLAGETVEEDILERAKRKRVLEHVVIHGVEGGHKTEGKEKEMAFKKEELSAILRFGAEKLFAKDRIGDGPDKGKDDDENAEAPTAKATASNDKDEKAEEKRVLAADDIDELLARAPTDETSEDAGAGGLGDSLLNAFKWSDFKTVEDEDDQDDASSDEKKDLANQAANRMVTFDKQVDRAKREEEKEKDMLNREGDAEFWNRVIPGEMKEDAMANDVVLGTRRRKRPNTFNSDSPEQGKRRRVTRAGRHANGKGSEDALTDKEQRSLLRSLRRFGDPRLISTILKDAGLENRVTEDDAMSMLNDCLNQAKEAIRRKKEDPDECDDPTYEASRSGKDSKSKSKRVLFDVLGESSVDAVELLKRCDDLQMLRGHISSFETDTQFRLRATIKPPTYSNIRWKAANDAMLLVGVCRHGLGNWTQIALDKQLNLADRMHVAGNTESKPGAPDTTKLLRRIMTLLRELERDIVSRTKTKARAQSSSEAKVVSKSTRSAKSTSDSKKKKKKKDSKKESKSRKSRNEGASHSESRKEADSMKQLKLRLKDANLEKLRELRALSKETCALESGEKIRKTKMCLVSLGGAIQKVCKSSEDTELELWKYVSSVCKTALPGDRLQAIYNRIAAANGTKEEDVVAG